MLNLRNTSHFDLVSLLRQTPTVFPTTEMVLLSSQVNRNGGANLDVADLLPLKLVYGLLQLFGGPCGIHGGSLELTFSLTADPTNV